MLSVNAKACVHYVMHDVFFTETMATADKRMLNGYHLRRRSIPPQLQSIRKVVVPKSLMNINDPMKSENFMKHFIAKMKKREARKVVNTLAHQIFNC